MKSHGETDTLILILPPSILIHFFRLIGHDPPEIGSTFKTIPTDQNSITLFWPRPFHIALAQLPDHQYYHIAVEEKYNQSSTMSKAINVSDRCAPIREVLNETIVQLHRIRRIKYYHLPCQSPSPLLACFYDDSHFCLCQDLSHQRLANCFEFNSSVKYDCFGQSNCEHGAQCLQDRPTCPQTSICLCPKCFYGMRCQFSSSLFSLSLDGILGYQIQPHRSIEDQPRIVKASIGLTTVMFVGGLCNGILSFITFKNKEPRKTGCGVYLFVSSMNSLFIANIFILKFSILILAQLTYMTQRSFLYVQCLSIDFLLHSGVQ